MHPSFRHNKVWPQSTRGKKLSTGATLHLLSEEVLLADGVMLVIPIHCFSLHHHLESVVAGGACRYCLALMVVLHRRMCCAKQNLICMMT